MSKAADLKALLQRVVELVMPNLRHYYRVPRKGLVVKSYASAGEYYADVQPLRNDDSVDKHEPLLTRVEIPVIWGGPQRGVICPPTPGTLCDITYYDGDPNYPRISNFRWKKNPAPACALDEFIIQWGPGVHIRITPEGDIDVKGQQKITATAPTVEVIAATKVTVTSPLVEVTAATSVTLTTPLLAVSGNITAGGGIVATGNVADAGGVKTMAAMRTAYNAHTHQENGDGGGTTNAPAAGM